MDPERLTEWDFWTRPVGNGPYRFVRLEPETMMEFEANPDFYMGKPRIERVILKFSLDAGLTELLGGYVDAIPSFPPASLPTVRGDSRFQVYYSLGDDGASTQAIYWNNDNPCSATRGSGAHSPWRSTVASSSGFWACPTTCRSSTAR